MGKKAIKKGKSNGAENNKKKDEYIIGTLTDQDIKNYVKRGKLITGDFKETSIKQACYELRASNTYYHPIESDVKKELKKDEKYILLRPNQLVVIITKEKLDIPNDILGRILTKGSLFSLGVNAVNTYVDPGFKGRLGIVFQNQTTQYLKIPVDQPIAKIEFSKLHKAVIEPYHGQHGYETEIWPIRRDFFVGEKELKDLFKVQDEFEELGLSYGKYVQNLVKRVLKLERRIVIALVIYSIITIGYMGIMFSGGESLSEKLNPLTSVIIGIGANIIFALLSAFFDRR